jgi:hypothetical protein
MAVFRARISNGPKVRRVDLEACHRKIHLDVRFHVEKDTFASFTDDVCSECM